MKNLDKLTPSAAMPSAKYFLFAFMSTLFTQVLWAQPVITSFSPTSGPIGTTVTITGTNFSATASDNIVYFGAVKATVTSATATSLKAIVPIGTTYQPITVTTNNLTAYSSKPFIVTFTGGGVPFSSTMFNTKMDFGTGNGPAWLSLGDLNGDGKVDLAIVNSNADSLQIVQNTTTGGTITFGTGVNYSTDIQPYDVSVGDFDGDGKLDLAVANFGSNTITIYQNTSSGGTISFGQAIYYQTGGDDAFPINIGIGDFDGDGKPDLAVINDHQGNLVIFQNTSTPGNISFSLLSTSYPAGVEPHNVAVGDINGDGKVDIAVANIGIGSNNVDIYENTSTTGNISFAQPISFTVGSDPACVVISDFDGDGKPDLAVADVTADSIQVLTNTGTGSNISFSAGVNYATAGYPRNISVTDLDGDGKPDIASVNYNLNMISLYRNTSSFGDISFDQKVDFTTGNNDYTVICGDINGDGKPDIATPNPGDNTFSILTNNVGVFPLHLLNFTGQLTNNQTKLQWQTTNEINTAYFSIERSTDGINFSALGTVASAGHSTTMRSYAFTDVKPKDGMNYYRLKMVDADGAFTYSNIVTISINVKNAAFAVYPNPANDYIVIQMPQSNNIAQLELIDMKGNVVKTLSVAQNTIQTTFSVQGIAAGTYKIIWTDGTTIQNQSLIVK